MFLQAKKRSQDIIAFNFHLPFSWFNFLSLLEEKRKKIIKKTRLSVTKAIKLFKYKIVIGQLKVEILD